MERRVSNFQTVPIGKRRDVFRQLIEVGNLGPVHQDGNDGNVPLKCGPDFNSHKVVGIIQTSCTGLVEKTDPVPSNHCQQYIATGNFFCQLFYKINSEMHAVDVNEYRVIPQIPTQPIRNAASITTCILAAITDEYLQS